MSRELRLFRRLVRALFPEDFRADYESEMARTFEAQYRDASAGGPRGVLRLWGETLTDLARTAPREHLAQLRQDVSYALRMMRRTPAFTAIAIVTLATGIGANTAIFSVVHAVLLRDLPYGGAGRVTRLWNQFPGGHGSALSYPELLDFRERLKTVDVAAWALGAATLVGHGDPERLMTAAVSPNLLDVFAVRPALGRVFRPEEERPGAAAVVMLTHELWQRRFDGDPAVLGRTVTLDRTVATIVGVLPSGFVLPDRFGAEEQVQLLEPLTVDVSAPRAERGSHFLRAAARLRPGCSLAQAQAEVGAVAAAWNHEYAGEYDAGYTAILRPVRHDIVRDVRPALLVLFGAVAFVLLIACANVANLLLARGQVRAREMAVRKAIGASHARLIRQVITEALVLAAAAAALGLGLAHWLTQLVVRTAPNIPRLDQVGLDPVVLAFTAAVAVLTAVVFGMLPALEHSRGDVAGRLHMARGGAMPIRHTVRAALVAAQVALAFVLLVGAALLIQSFTRLTSVPSGIDPEQVLTMRVSIPADGYRERERAVAFFERLLEGIRAVPGVDAAGAVTNVPLGEPIGDWDFYLPGETPGPHGSDRSADWQVVTPGYFEAMGVPLRRGRFITARDAWDAPAVVVVNETLAGTYLSGRDPIGVQIRMSGGDRPWMTIVGVAADVRHNGLAGAADPQVYIPHAQFIPFWPDTTVRSLAVVIRSASGAQAAVSAVRARVRELDPNLALARVRTMDAVLDRAVAAERLPAQLLAIFAAIALVLAVVGTYGVLAYQINERTREFGVRVALGARSDEIVRMVVRDGMTPAIAGVLIGIGCAAALTRVLTTLLFETEPLDIVTFATTSGVLLAAALAACCVPAGRAARVDPATALRAD